MKYGFGIDVGGTTVKMGFFSEDGTLLHSWEIPTDCTENGRHILPDIAKAVQAHLAQTGIGHESVLGIGIGVPGPVNSRGIVNRCINLGWGVLDLKGELEALTGLPVQAGNDANVAALGECWKGGGQGKQDMVLATLGTGIGGGILVGGKMIHGVHGGGGEIGHLNISRTETVPCNCGNYGCAEQYGSATGIVRTAKRFLETCDAPSTLRELETLTAEAIFDAGKANDALALEILEQVFDDLGVFLACVCSVCDPEIIVLGGGVSKAGQILLDGVAAHFKKYMFHTGRNIAFALATLGNEAGIYGAFKMALDAI